LNYQEQHVLCNQLSFNYVGLSHVKQHKMVIKARQCLWQNLKLHTCINKKIFPYGIQLLSH